MKKHHWQISLGLGLILFSVLFYYIHYLVFHDSHHIFIYFLGDVAFVFIEVLLVTLIIHKVLEERERKQRLKKLDMVIGAFYSEVGVDLITILSEFNPNTDDICDKLVIDSMWTDKRFKRAQKTISGFQAKIECDICHLEELKAFLDVKRVFLLQLLQNPVLFEHDSFSDLLWGIFHISEEFGHRDSIKDLPESDYEHLAGDIERVYAALISEWLAYMKHLKDGYPYLFSLAIRTNPFAIHCTQNN